MLDGRAKLERYLGKILQCSHLGENKGVVEKDLVTLIVVRLTGREYF